MFNKEEQRRRAAELTAKLAAEGKQVPVLAPIPVVKKKGPVDMNGVELQVGQKVAQAAVIGNTPRINVRTVARIEGFNVWLDGSNVVLKYPSRLLVI